VKKIIISAIFILLLALAAVYFFIPSKLKISGAVTYQANRESITRFLGEDKNWGKWWPGTITKNAGAKSVFSYNGYNFEIKEILYNAFILKLTKSNDSSASLLKIISLKTDSVGIELETELTTGSSPFSKIAGYSTAKKLKKTFDDILSALQQHTSVIKNIYGFEIKNEKVEMQYLVSTSQTFNHYPATENIYPMITLLRTFINKHNGKEEFFPMLNIETADSINFQARVGVPVNQKLPEEGNISAKMMVKNGNILTAEVTGGPEQIAEAMKQFEKYIQDYQRSIIAIPFQSLITDRSKEPDSNKWVTKIYYPVV
jgi:hypothetical protein